MKIILETSRMYLRESTAEDELLAYELNLDPDVMKYTGDVPFESVAEARTFLENYDAYEKHGMGRWYAFSKENDEFLGWCGLKNSPEIKEIDLGYRFFKKHWGKGYATESAIACIHYGFTTLGLTEIVGKAEKNNPASIKVMQKCGMQFHSDVEFDGIPGVKYIVHKETWKKI